jgi:hypothetical protein
MTIGSRSPSHRPSHHPQRAVNATAPRIHGQFECLGDGRADAPNGAFVGSDCRRDMVAVGACGDGQRRLSASVNLCPSFQATRPGGKGFPRNRLFAGERAPRPQGKPRHDPCPNPRGSRGNRAPCVGHRVRLSPPWSGAPVPPPERHRRRGDGGWHWEEHDVPG